MHPLLLLLTPWFSVAATAGVCQVPSPFPPWNLPQFKFLITFGDSYTDDNRLNHFIQHNGSAPPLGSKLPQSPDLRNWARYVEQYSIERYTQVPDHQIVEQESSVQKVNRDSNHEGARHSQGLSLYNYAVSGAVCSNAITPRPFPLIHGNFPSVIEYQVPTFLAEKPMTLGAHNQPFFQPPLSSSNAVYAIFIGTNDLGNIAFLTDSQIPGRVLRDYTECVYEVLDALYASGARYFVLLNAVPLHLAPQYANGTLNGVAATQYFPDKPTNITMIATRMHEQTTSVNEIFKYKTPYEVLVSKRYPGSNFALFDVWQLFSDIYHNPELHLNGSQPVTTRDWLRHCNITGANCGYRHNNTSPDSFMWWDELHPTEQVHRILAREIVNTIDGRDSEYATYWSD